MKKDVSFLKSGSFVKNKYRKILTGTVLAWIVSMINTCADSIIAGTCLGEDSVSAISLVQPFSSVIVFLCYLISVGTAVMYSRESGAFHKDKSYRIVGQGIICAAGISVFLVVSMIALQSPIMAFYNSSKEITELAGDYYSCEIFFAAIIPFYYVLYQLVEADGDVMVDVLACIGSAVSNVVISLLLVNSMGIKGLAFGTIFSTVIGFIIYCLHFLKKSNSIRIKFQFKPKEILEIAKISSSTSLTLLYIAIIDVLMNKFVILRFSDEYLPAYAVVNLVLNLGAVFAACYDSASGFLSVAYGENNPDSIRKIMRIATKSSLILSVVVMVVLELLSTSMPSLYGITDPNVKEASVFASRVIALSCPSTAIYYLYCGYYPAMNHIRLGHLLSITYMLISPLALAIPLGIWFGFDGLSIGFMLTSIVSVLIALVVILIKYGKKNIPLVLQETDEEILSYELRLTKDNISALCDKVKSDLTSRGINSSVINEVQLILEEGYVTILETNSSKKVLTECNILISDKVLRLITRDNGKIFDITNANVKVKNLRSFVLALLMERNPERVNTTTISFNRNSYYWNLEE